VNNIKGSEKIILKERSILLNDIIDFKDYMALVVYESNSCVKHRWNNTGMRRITKFGQRRTAYTTVVPQYYNII